MGRNRRDRVEDEPLLAAALSTDAVFRRSDDGPRHVLGPYYSRSIAIVALNADVFVLFGAEDDGIEPVTDQDLRRLARCAGDAILEVGPAKRLADELEALNAVRELLHAPAETFDDALQRLSTRRLLPSPARSGFSSFLSRDGLPSATSATCHGFARQSSWCR